MDICSPNVGPYMGVVKDETRQFKDGPKLRFIMYRAYNAMGLIGSECNGIVVLNEDKMNVVADEIAKADSGYSMPTQVQLQVWEVFTKTGSWTAVRNLIASSRRCRYVP